MVRDTSLQALRNHKEKLNKYAESVLLFLTIKGNATNLEISDFSGLPINIVSGRMNDLVKKGLVVEGPKRECKISKNTVIEWRPVV